jgi:hypothetical protein
VSSLTDRGFNLLNKSKQTAAATTVRVIRGSEVVSDGMQAVLSAPQIEFVSNAGSLVGRQFRWDLKREQFKYRGKLDEPRALDRIEWSLNGRLFVFEVLSRSNMPEMDAVDPRSDWLPASAKLAEIK